MVLARLEKHLGVANIWSGTATIPAGDTSVLVTHNLGSVPVVKVTPYHKDGVQAYADEASITATTFTVNIPVEQDAALTFGCEAVI